MKYFWKVLAIIVGLVAVVVLVLVAVGKKSTGPLVSPGSGPEGTEITATYPKTVSVPAGSFLKFTDSGERGYYAVNNGAATYVTYDSSKGLSYAAALKPSGSDNSNQKFSATVPSGICGLVIQSAQAPAAPPKVLTVSLLGPDGKALPGAAAQAFNLLCDKYTLNIKIVASKDPVLPDGASQSNVTATLSVKGPAQFVNGKKVKPSDPKIMLESPLGFVMTHFTTDLGVLNPNPANVKTAADGTATVSISSADAGIATVRAIAFGIGDASVKVHFPPKISGVTQNFVQPNSPTNYQMATIPANPKDLNFDWVIIPAPGPLCGSLTGAANGKGEASNGFFHGPQFHFPDGCPQPWEFATQIKVTVTDKDGQSDSKTFSARAFEGQGLVKLP